MTRLHVLMNRRHVGMVEGSGRVCAMGDRLPDAVATVWGSDDLVGVADATLARLVRRAAEWAEAAAAASRHR